jgi:predicted Zn-dependent protease
MHRDIEHAAKLHQAGQTKEALKLLQKLAKQHPSDPSVSVNYGLLLLESGNLDKARQRLRRTVSKHANYAPGQYAMGRFFIQSDRPQLASRHFKIASELEPKNISYCMEACQFTSTCRQA